MILRDKTALVTGGSSGVGYALSRRLIEEGSDVYSISIDEPQRPIEGVNYLTGDIRSSDRIRNAVSEIPNRVDVLFNNAGIVWRGGLFDITEQRFDEMWAVNVKASWLIMKHLRELEKLANDATIVHTSSSLVSRLASDPGVYIWTKMAMRDFADELKAAFPQYSVKTLLLGPIDTPFFYHDRDQGPELIRENYKPQSPDYVAEWVLILLKSDKTKLTFNNERREYELE